MRLKESALLTLELNTSARWHLNPSSTPQSPTISQTSMPSTPTPPWHNDSTPNQCSLILCTASNMHRAELLETITQWYEDSMGESLCVEQVPYLGSPPAAKPSLSSNSASSYTTTLSSPTSYVSTSMSSDRPSVNIQTLYLFFFAC